MRVKSNPPRRIGRAAGIQDERNKKMSRKKQTMTAAEIEAGLNGKVRTWLLRNHPEEETMIGDFSKGITFRRLGERMRNGENFYDICDCTESVQREYCFARLAELFGTNYEYWYRTWRDGTPPKSMHPRMVKSKNSRIELITRITK